MQNPSLWRGQQPSAVASSTHKVTPHTWMRYIESLTQRVNSSSDFIPQKVVCALIAQECQDARYTDSTMASKLCTCGTGSCSYHREANRKSQEKHREKNQEKRRAESRAYYHTHKAVMRAQNKEWIQKNKDFDRRRSNIRRRSGARLKKQDYLAVFDYYGAECVYCGVQTTGLDHLRPLSKGGSGSSIHNLAPCCPHCNSIKGTRPIWTMLNREVTYVAA